jgi:tetratricopeptide (TPR) repeat protein
MRSPGAARRWLMATGIALGVAGCAAPGLDRLARRDDLPRRAELAATPFFPQEEFQCGPAALATTLNAIGVAVAPEQLVPEVYLPARQGSLQIEMLAAARRQGAVAYVIPDRLDALAAEIAAGNPVLVLQNLGLSWVPSWHYAVVVGYDLEAGEVVLRSGPMRRQVMSVNTFANTWNRSERWGFVTLPPGRLPVSIDAPPAVEAILAFARVGSPEAVYQAYAGAAQRWPQDLALAIGLGNSAYALGRREEARQVFEQASQTHPESAAAHNNLAHVLAELGQLPAARAAAERAVALGGPGGETAAQTLEDIRRREKPAPSAR